MAPASRWSDESEGDQAPLGTKRALRELAALFRKVDAVLEPFGCDRSGRCCQLARTGREPYLFPIELALLRTALEARRLVARPDGACPLLDPSGLRCSVYTARPFGCRTFFCERGRGPTRYPDSAIRTLTARLTDLSDRIDPGAHPRPLRELLGEALITRDDRNQP